MYDTTDLCLRFVETIDIVSASGDWLCVGKLISWAECWFIIP